MNVCKSNPNNSKQQVYASQLLTKKCLVMELQPNLILVIQMMTPFPQSTDEGY